MATTTHGHAATARQQLVRLLLGGGGGEGSGSGNGDDNSDNSAQTLSRAQLETALRAVDTRLEAKQNALRELITGGGNDAMNAATDTSTTTATNAATPSIHRFQHFLHATRDKNARAQRLLDARKLLDERRTDMDALAMDVTSMERLFAKRQRMLAVRRVCRRVVKALRRGREAARMLDDEAEHASVSNVAVATAAMGTGAQVDATWHHSPAQALSHVEAWRTLRDALAEVEEQVDAHRASETTQDSSAIISNKRHSVASLSGERALRSASFSSTNQLHHSATASSSFWTVAQAQVVRRLHNRERAFRATLTGRLVDALNALTRRRHGNRDAEADAAATSTIDIQFLADMERLCNALFTFDGALDAWMQAFVKRFGTEVVAAVVLGSIKSVQVERVGNDGLFLRLVANNVDARGKESDVVDDNERAIRLHNAASALDFLHQLIPAPHRQLLQKLVNTVVFPDITAKVINNLLMPALPARFEDLPRVADQLRVALAPLLACQLVAGADIATVAKPLNEFVANLENLFADSRCESLLLQARDVLMKEDFANVLIMEVAEEDLPPALADTTLLSSSAPISPTTSAAAVSSDFDREVFGEFFEELNGAPFLFPTCRISAKAQRLHQIAVLALREASDMGERSLETMLATVLDIYDLYRVLIPLFHDEHHLERALQQECILYNDYTYLAHQLLLHSLSFALPSADPSRPASLRATAPTFLAHAHAFRHLAHKALRAMLQRQRAEMVENLNIACEGTFRNAHDAGRRAAIERGLGQCTYQLRHMLKLLKPLFPPHLLLSVAGWLVGEVGMRCVELVEAVGELGETECEALHELLVGGDEAFERKAVELIRTEVEVAYSLWAARSSSSTSTSAAFRAKTLITSSTTTTSPSPTSLLTIDQLTATYLPPTHSHFSAIAHTLHYPLATIMERYRKGYYVEAGLKLPHELTRMVRCIFSDSEKRHAAISEIMQGGTGPTGQT